MYIGAVHLIGELLLAERFPLLAVNEHFRKRFAAWEATDVGNKNTVAAEDHVVFL